MKKYIKIILSFFIISGTIFLTHRELNAQDGKSFGWSGSAEGDGMPRPMSWVSGIWGGRLHKAILGIHPTVFL